jgi:hypothetical protein
MLAWGPGQARGDDEAPVAPDLIRGPADLANSNKKPGYPTG